MQQIDIKKEDKFKKILEKIIENLFFICAIVAVLCVIVITLFIFYRGTPAMFEIGLGDFILGKEWKPSGSLYGILPMIIGSLYSTTGAIIIGVPIGILTAVFITEIAP